MHHPLAHHTRTGTALLAVTLLCVGSGTLSAEAPDVAPLDSAYDRIHRCHVRPLDIDGDGTYELGFTDGEAYAGVFRQDGTRVWERIGPKDAKGHRDPWHLWICPAGDFVGDAGEELVAFSAAEGGSIEVLDGRTGEVLHTAPHGLKRFDARAVVADLGGDRPAIVAGGGDNCDAVVAFDGQLNVLWRDKTPGSGHHIYPAQLDDDPADELLIGKYAYDHDGTRLWTLPKWKRDHIDSQVVGDLLPERPGVEMVVTGISGFQLWQITPEPKLLWKADKSIAIDPQGVLVGDFEPSREGLEILMANKGWTMPTYLLTMQGEVIRKLADDGPRPTQPVDLHGTASDLRVLFAGGGMFRTDGTVVRERHWFAEMPEGEDKVVDHWCFYPLGFDLVGDGREELLVWGKPGLMVIEFPSKADAPVPVRRTDLDYRRRLINAHPNRSFGLWDFGFSR